jgi:hypothetical protein
LCWSSSRMNVVGSCSWRSLISRRHNDVGRQVSHRHSRADRRSRLTGNPVRAECQGDGTEPCCCSNSWMPPGRASTPGHSLNLGGVRSAWRRGPEKRTPAAVRPLDPSLAPPGRGCDHFGPPAGGSGQGWG